MEEAEAVAFVATRSLPLCPLPYNVPVQFPPRGALYLGRKRLGALALLKRSIRPVIHMYM